MNAIKQTRFFAQNYHLLQGLRAVPLGLCLLIVTLWANQQTGPTRDLTIPLTASLFCLVFYIIVDQYYKRVYGKVKRKTTVAEWLLQVIAAIFALAAFVIDTSNKVNFSVLGIIFAATFFITAFWYWRSSKVLLLTSLVFALIFAGLSILSLAGVKDWWHLFGINHSLRVFTSLYGIFCIIAGIIAHIYFVKSLPRMTEAA